MALGALVEADEHIPFRLGHTTVSWMLGVASRLQRPAETPRAPQVLDGIQSFLD